MRGKPPLRVAVVSPYEIARRGVCSFMAGREDVTPAAVTDVCRDVGVCDVIVYDLVGMMGTGECELAELLFRRTPVLGIEVPSREDLTESALRMGVADVIPRSVSGPCFLEAVQRAAGGCIRTCADYRQERHADVKERYGLTEREASVLGLIAAGLSNREVADQMFLSVNSVKTYIRSAYRRIDVGSRSEAVLWATRHGLGEPDPREHPLSDV